MIGLEQLHINSKVVGSCCFLIGCSCLLLPQTDLRRISLQKEEDTVACFVSKSKSLELNNDDNDDTDCTKIKRRDPHFHTEDGGFRNGPESFHVLCSDP